MNGCWHNNSYGIFSVYTLLCLFFIITIIQIIICVLALVAILLILDDDDKSLANCNKLYINHIFLTWILTDERKMIYIIADVKISLKYILSCTQRL